MFGEESEGEGGREREGEVIQEMWQLKGGERGGREVRRGEASSIQKGMLRKYLEGRGGREGEDGRGRLIQGKGDGTAVCGEKRGDAGDRGVCGGVGGVHEGVILGADGILIVFLGPAGIC